MAQAGRSGSFGNFLRGALGDLGGPLEVPRLEEGPGRHQVEAAVFLVLLEGDEERLDGGGEVLRLEEGEPELAVDRGGLGGRLGGDLVVLEGGLHLPGRAGRGRRGSRRGAGRSTSAPPCGGGAWPSRRRRGSSRRGRACGGGWRPRRLPARPTTRRPSGACGPPR